jgi:hypothetical protein
MFLDGSDHFSGIRVASDLKRPTRRPRPGQPVAAFRRRRQSSSYLVLHRATLTMPVMSPSPRWALTPPFHPCLIRCDLIGIHVALAIGGLFSVVPVSDRSAWALSSALPSKSGLSSRAVTSDHPILSLARLQYRKTPARDATTGAI